MDCGPVSRRAKMAGRERASTNPFDASARGLASGDIVRIFNERGECLGGVQVDPGTAPGVVRWLWLRSNAGMTTDQESNLLSQITSSEAGKCRGQPCVRGMRIRVVDILEMLADNVPADEILKDFPDLEAEDIQASLIFAARRAGHARLEA